MSRNGEIEEHTRCILNNCGDPQSGLPEDVFLMVSALIPVPNVDLFVFNKRGEILLAWRDDSFFGKGWSIPGGCMRFGERLEERIHKTALSELHVDVDIIEGPISARDVIRGPNYNLKYPNVRGHNITIPFLCKLKNDVDIDNCNLSSMDNGYLKWFNFIPKDILKVHHVYDDLFEKYGLEVKAEE